MVKFLLERAKLELYQEIQAVISSSAVLRRGTGHNTLPVTVNTKC
jgi:hypothetical protein